MEFKAGGKGGASRENNNKKQRSVLYLDRRLVLNRRKDSWIESRLLQQGTSQHGQLPSLVLKHEAGQLSQGRGEGGKLFLPKAHMIMHPGQVEGMMNIQNSRYLSECMDVGKVVNSKQG